MRKFLIGSMAVLCTLLTSCSKQELNYETPQTHEVDSRSPSEITLNYLDQAGVLQSLRCKRASLTYLSNSTIELDIVHRNGSSQTVIGDEISILPVSQNLKIASSSNGSFLTTDLYVEKCGFTCCFTYNNGNNVGTDNSFIVAEEPTGF